MDPGTGPRRDGGAGAGDLAGLSREVHAYLAPDALRVLTGEGRAAVDADDALQVTGPPVSA